MNSENHYKPRMPRSAMRIPKYQAERKEIPGKNSRMFVNPCSQTVHPLALD